MTSSALADGQTMSEKDVMQLVGAKNVFTIEEIVQAFRMPSRIITEDVDGTERICVPRERLEQTNARWVVIQTLAWGRDDFNNELGIIAADSRNHSRLAVGWHALMLQPQLMAGASRTPIHLLKMKPKGSHAPSSLLMTLAMQLIRHRGTQLFANRTLLTSTPEQNGRVQVVSWSWRGGQATTAVNWDSREGAVYTEDVQLVPCWGPLSL